MKEQHATENYNVDGMERVRSKGGNEEWKMEWNMRGTEGGNNVVNPYRTNVENRVSS